MFFVLLKDLVSQMWMFSLWFQALPEMMGNSPTCFHIPGLLWMEVVEREDPGDYGFETTPRKYPPGGWVMSYYWSYLEGHQVSVPESPSVTPLNIHKPGSTIVSIGHTSSLKGYVQIWVL